MNEKKSVQTDLSHQNTKQMNESDYNIAFSRKLSL